MGNVAGVAVAITQGGPGALFWMWVCALLGMATKFYTCSLAVMYRGKDENGVVQGGPMYFIREGLGKKWRPLAVFFAACGMFGCLPLLQSNQLTQIVRSMFFEPQGWFVGAERPCRLEMLYLVCCLRFLSEWWWSEESSGLAPLPPGLFLVWFFVRRHFPGHSFYSMRTVFYLPLSLILSDAFTGQAVAGGALGMVIVTGVRRAAFSNEAGMGTEAMAHGAAKTKEPITGRLGGDVGTGN